MIATNHALTGAIIGLTVHNPLVAIPVALVSHVICDAVPHYGSRNGSHIATRGFARYLLVDAAACGLLVLLLFFIHNPSWLLASICAFVATSPDFLWIRKFVAARKGRRIHLNIAERFLKNIQWFERPIGAVVEVFWFFSAIVVLSAII